MFAQHDFETSLLLESSRQQIGEMPVLVLNAHGRCNCRCVMCDIWKREETAEVRVADLERHRGSLRRLSVRWAILSGGEPLMHNDLRALCTFFRELDIRLTLLTTGLLLTRRATEVSELFDDVIISLDGPAAVHDAIRRVKDGFRLIQSGIVAVRQLRPTIRITGRTTVQKANHRHLQDTVLTAKALELDSISFLAADVTSVAFNRPLIWPGERQSEVALSADEMSELEQEMEELIARFEAEILTGYVAETPDKLRRIVTHFKALLGHAQHESPACNAPWVSAVIEADGAVRPCFFHPTIGNIHQSSLEEIVNGEKAWTFRRNLEIADNPTCKRCVCSLNYPTSQGSQL